MSLMSTTLYDITATLALRQAEIVEHDNELSQCYDDVIKEQRLTWTTHQRLKRLLGKGGQGLVYLSERRGVDDFTLPVAVKVFSPKRFATIGAYEQAMERIASIAAHVAQIQQDNLLDVHNFIDRRQIRMMEMEWVDGYDLRYLLNNDLLKVVSLRVDDKRWRHICQVIITPGDFQPRIQPGVAVSIVRECLAALAALHREGIVHGDIKPANIMLKRTGNAKIVDIGSAFHVDDPPATRTCTPTYAAPEVLQGSECTPRSDLASLGYVLIEMMAGGAIFPADATFGELLEAKLSLSRRLDELLPADITCNDLLMNFCRGLIAPDPMRRFPSAEAANMLREGAAAFLRQLIKTDLAAEYDNEIRLFIEELKSMEGPDGSDG